MLSKKRKSSESGLFLEKLYKILEDPENSQIIHWNEDGTKVIISDPIEFTVKILPKHFNHKNYSSFVRQLNNYGFSKISNIYISTEEQYINENFKKDNNKDIKNIKKIKNQNIILDRIKKENNDEKKNIEDFIKLIENGNINIKPNIQFIEFLIGKIEEKNNFDEKIKKEISRIQNKNNILEKEIDKLKSKIDDSIGDYNELLNISSHLKETSKKKVYSIQSGESLTFKKKEKVKECDNLYASLSFSEEFSKADYPKNPPIQTENQSSLIVLNKSRLFCPYK